MLNIFVLEKDFYEQARIEKAIEKAKKIHFLKIGQINIHDKTNQLLDEITERGSHMLFFLDIQSASEVEEGFLVAQEIRRRDPYATIVFVTAHPELLPLAFQYRVSALDFIDKKLSEQDYEDRIITDIELALIKNGYSLSECSFALDTKNATIQVPFHKILFFETSSTVHKIILHTIDEQIEFYGQLSKVVAQDSRLYKCHKSFVVNPENIVRLDKELSLAYFENGESCLVSKAKQKYLVSLILSLNEQVS